MAELLDKNNRRFTDFEAQGRVNPPRPTAEDIVQRARDRLQNELVERLKDKFPNENSLMKNKKKSRLD